jgi:hypothetical protein
MAGSVFGFSLPKVAVCFTYLQWAIQFNKGLITSKTVGSEA